MVTLFIFYLFRHSTIDVGRLMFFLVSKKPLLLEILSQDVKLIL